MSSDEKVILIAHSFGGFVVKNALSALESEGKEDLVRSVIYVAVPETGAPQAIFSAIHGDEQSILKGIIMDSMAAIRLAANMTSAHIVAPSAYFAGPIILEFLNKKTGIMTAYASSSDTSNRYSLASTHAWLIKAMRGADKQLGQESDSPAVRGFSSAPSASLSSLADIAKDDLYRQSAVLENAFRTYSIIGIGLPTPIGMRYQYAPCVPPKKKSFSDFGALSPCLNASALTRTTSYSKNGDGVVVFDGKDRRSGTDSIISLLESNMRDKTSIGHANIMESADIQAKITDMIKATSSPQTDPFYEGASGTGSNEINPWINTGKIFGLDISGFVEGRVQANVSRLTSQISASSTSIAALQIVTLDHAKKIQIIRGEPDVLAATTAINSSDRWSFGSAGTYDEVSLRSLADQSVTIAFSEHSEGPSFSGDSRIGIVETVTTESFSGVDVGFGSVMNIETQYVTADPSRTLTLDIDADDIGDMSIGPDSIESVGSGGSTGIQTALTYDGMKTLALSSIRDAKISISQLEIYALRQTNTAMLSWMERYLHAGNPTFALLTIKKRQVRLAEISAQYALRIKALEHGLLEGIRRGFRTPAERTKKDAEIIKIRAYLRDLARLKIILKAVEQRAIDLLI